jgi:hypothetical protein
MAFTQTTLGTSPVELFTADRNIAVTALYLANTSASPVTVTVYLVPTGGSAGSGTTVYKDHSVAANSTSAVLTERIVLENGDSIWGAASAGSSILATVCSIGV